jgi:hypothetical protein
MCSYRLRVVHGCEMMDHFLVTYHPLGESRQGRNIALKAGIPPFADGSCRREPDLEHQYPSITSLCRNRRFVPRLDEDDYVAYLTVQGIYPPHRERHWRLVALLRVRKVYLNHAQAAEWYLRHGHRLPYNCVVPGNRPLPLSMTNRAWSSIHDWDRRYRTRSENCPTFAVCDVLFRELDRPPIVTREDLERIFDGVPATLTPPRIDPKQFRQLSDIAGVRIA